MGGDVESGVAWRRGEVDLLRVALVVELLLPQRLRGRVL